MLNGEAQARFSQVVMPYLGDALALARWLTGSAADAEDVVQEACMKAYAGIGGYAGGNARAWLLERVASDVIQDSHLRLWMIHCGLKENRDGQAAPDGVA